MRVEPGDLRDVSRLQSLVEKVSADLGGVDELVNVPEITGSAGFQEVTREEWDRTFEVNSKRVFFLMQAAARVMAAQGGGRIVNVVNVDAKGWWGTEAPALAATGAAVIAVGRIAALQLSGHDINVNTVCTGLFVLGGKIASLAGAPLRSPGPTGSNGQSSSVHVIPLDRANEAEDVVATVEFLLSPGARNITGQSLNVDGGLVFD